ncbi:cupin domain-containing protein [Sphingomonas crocodyli]|uniref:Cupin domain-containing protein n=1 Tax=Sphingomonas crocodyli TaxID=1979270 RepID=A0A437M7V6_9SPHN|nr:cupin domain-containing protein [Sphingomonas crocodyli]RVT93667.1 cupin domain-containing protein [Sphingomonas crocodyli]
MPRIDLDAVPQTNATGYPPPYSNDVQGRFYRRLAPAGGITDFGASHVVLKPGGWSSQRHWHEGEDEIVVMIAGEAVLIDDNGRTPVRPGDILAFPKGDGNGHHLINESDADCVFVAVGRPSATDCHYPDIDMHLSDGAYQRRDGTTY